MKLYPLLSHNIEIVKFLVPITTNPMKENEQKKSLNTNQRHSTVQWNAMHMLWYKRLSHYIPVHPKKVHYGINEMKNCWFFSKKKFSYIMGNFFFAVHCGLFLLQVSKVWHWFFLYDEWNVFNFQRLFYACKKRFVQMDFKRKFSFTQNHGNMILSESYAKHPSN